MLPGLAAVATSRALVLVVDAQVGRLCTISSEPGKAVSTAVICSEAALQVVSEMLSRHVLQNYDKFVAGVNEISAVEGELQVRMRSGCCRSPRLHEGTPNCLSAHGCESLAACRGLLPSNIPAA